MSDERRFTLEEKYGFVKQYLSGTDNQIIFSDKHNLKLSAFKYWLKKYRRENNVVLEKRSSQHPTFIPIKVKGSAAVKHNNSGKHILVDLSDGTRINIPSTNLNEEVFLFVNRLRLEIL